MKSLGIFFLFFVFLDVANAQEKSLNKCEQDLVQFCGADYEESYLSKVRNNLFCLMRNRDQISVECKEDLERIMQANRQSMNRGGGALSSLGGVGPLSPVAGMISVEDRVARNEDWSQSRVNINIPIYKREHWNSTISLANAVVHLGSQKILDSGRLLPNNLYRDEMGLQVAHGFGQNQSLSMRGSVGYSSDRPFEDGSVASYSLSGGYTFANDGDEFWAATVYVSNNSPFGTNIPIPGFVYFYRSQNFSGVFGFPIALLQWTLSQDLMTSVSFFGPSLNAELVYGEFGKPQTYLGTAWSRQSFILQDRVVDTDKLTLEEKKLFVGERAAIFGFLRGELQIGQSFDRSGYLGSGYRNTDRGYLALDSESYAQISLRAIF